MIRSAPYLHDPTRYFARLANGGWSGMAYGGDDLFRDTGAADPQIYLDRLGKSQVSKNRRFLWHGAYACMVRQSVEDIQWRTELFPGIYGLWSFEWMLFLYFFKNQSCCKRCRYFVIKGQTNTFRAYTKWEGIPVLLLAGEFWRHSQMLSSRFSPLSVKYSADSRDSGWEMLPWLWHLIIVLSSVELNDRRVEIALLIVSKIDLNFGSTI